MSIDNKFYIGIDESNNGRTPEIMVMVYSHNFYDAKKLSTPVKKIRTRRKISLEKILKGRDMKFTLATQELKDTLGKFYKPYIIASLIISLGNVNIEKILVDGYISEEEIKLIHELLSVNYKHINKEKIQQAPKHNGNHQYMVTHIADACAYFLFKKFKKRPQSILTLPYYTPLEIERIVNKLNI